MFHKTILALSAALLVGLAAFAPTSADARPAHGGFHRAGIHGGFHGGFRHHFGHVTYRHGLRHRFVAGGPVVYGYGSPCIRVHRTLTPWGVRYHRVNVCG
jgi:hypothetical protein